MKPTKRLVLKRERLAELSSDELTQVAGGTHMCLTIPPLLCLSVQRCYVTHQAECLVPTLPDTCAC